MPNPGDTSFVANVRATKSMLDSGSISPIRVVYWFSTVFISIIGVIMGLYEFQNKSLSSLGLTGAAYWVWFRTFLGVVQFRAHAFKLFPMRVNTAAAEAKNGLFTLPPKVFYKFINICNVAITLVLIGSSFQIRRLLDQDALESGAEVVFLWGECFSALVWGTVLTVRIVAILADTAKDWFFLAWSPAFRKGTKTSQ